MTDAFLLFTRSQKASCLPDPGNFILFELRLASAHLKEMSFLAL